MSFGKKTPTYKPVARTMLDPLAEHFKNLSRPVITSLYEIMTANLHTETLLFVWILDTLDRFLEGDRDEASFGFGAGIKLSVLSKGASLSDMRNKAQSTLMEYFHDVLVELSMAGENYSELQKFLASEFGLTIALYHSCGSAIIRVQDLQGFYLASREAQYLRTWLDWEAGTEKNTPEEELIADYQYGKNEAAAVSRCFTIACEAVGADRFVS